MTLLNEIWSQNKFFFQTIIIAILMMMSYLFISDNRGRIKERLIGLVKKKWIFLFLLYCSYVIASTLIVRYRRNPYQSIFRHLWFSDDAGWNAEIIKNILFFIPYGFFYLKAFSPSKPGRSCLILSFCTSICIEVLQLVFWVGEFQFADLIDNTIGGMLGYALWLLICTSKERNWMPRIRSAIRKKLKKD